MSVSVINETSHTVNAAMTYGDWTLRVDDDRVAWVGFDKQDSRVNILDQTNLEDLRRLLTDLRQAVIRAMVIQSAKPTGFIAGADIKLFKAAKTEPKQVQAFIEQGQAVFQLLESTSFPTIAVIDGFCLGGGLELALACTYRIAVQQEKTSLGLPEVKLGIHPGWGGSVRLPRLVGPVAGLELTMSGRSVDGRQALRLKLVDILVLKRHLPEAITQLIRQDKQVRRPSWANRLLSTRVMRPVVAAMMKRKLSEKLKAQHYPAPFVVLENWKKAEERALPAAYQDEAQSILALIQSETAQNMVRTFFLQERLKGTRLAVRSEQTVQHVHVIGAGRMGGDIAAWSVLKGNRVSIYDENPDRVAVVLAEARALFTKKLKDPYLIQAAMDRLMPDVLNAELEKADLILEAVTEQLGVKQAIFREVERRAKPEAILATNTSTIPIEQIATCLKQPKRLLGIHFFNPVPLMPLVELIEAEHTDQASLAVALAWIKQLGKLPLLVKSRPGFLVNRILVPYLIESVCLVEEGIPKAVIDRVAVDYGMPMGPLALMDTVGLDVCWMAAEQLFAHSSEALPMTLKRLVDSGALGKKSGRGFYQYVNGKPVKEASGYAMTAPADLLDRLLMRMWNEAQRVVAEGVVQDRDLVDAGLIFGAGFPAFTGGLNHAIAAEQAAFDEKRRTLAVRYGERFGSIE